MTDYTTTTTTTTPTPPPPPAAAAPPRSAEAPPPHIFSEWPGSIQALYGGAATPATATAPHPYMMAPNGAPFAFLPVYHRGGSGGGAAYAHPPVPSGSVYIAAREERRMAEAKKAMEAAALMNAKPPGSVDEDEDYSQSDCDSEGSGEVREESTDTQSKKKFSFMFGDGGITQHATNMQHISSTAESRPAMKLPVSAPGRTVSENPATSLNVGMELLSTPHVNSKVHNAMDVPMGTSSMVGQKGFMPGQRQMLDERELKKERRKQSNRESARRSRLRKQQECEDLTRRVDQLSNESSSLRSELEQLNKDCGILESENTAIEEELVQWFGPGILSAAMRANSNELLSDSDI